MIGFASGGSTPFHTCLRRAVAKTARHNFANLKEVGEPDAEWVADAAAGRRVRIGVIAGAPGAASGLLVDGSTRALPANAKVVAAQPGMFDAAKAKSAAAIMTKTHPDLDYAFVANEETAFGAREAFDAAGATDVRTVTVNGTDEGLAALKDGRFAATVSNSVSGMGRMAVQNTIAPLRDEHVDKIAKAWIRLVTKDNADTAPLHCPTDQ